jgi:hypothetical protein
MNTRQKKNPGGAAGAEVYSRSDQSVAHPIPASVEVPAAHPGDEFWLRTDDYDGTEYAHEREPPLPHLTVKVVTGGDGKEYEQTWTRTRKVRNEDGDADFITPRPPSTGGWKAHELPKVETYDTFGVWRRPLSRGWRLIEDGRYGHVWSRGGPPPEKVLGTYTVIERPEDGEPIRLEVTLIDTGVKDGLVEETKAKPGLMLWGIGLRWEAAGEWNPPEGVVWRRPYVRKGGAR